MTVHNKDLTGSNLEVAAVAVIVDAAAVGKAAEVVGGHVTLIVTVVVMAVAVEVEVVDGMLHREEIEVQCNMVVLAAVVVEVGANQSVVIIRPVGLEVVPV